VLAALAFLFFVKPQRASAHAPVPFWHSLRSLPRRYYGFLAAVFVFGLGDFARTLLILRATHLLDPSLGPARAAATAIALYMVHNVVYAAASYPVGALADRVRPDRLLVIGYLAGTATAVLAAVATPSLAVLAAVFIAGGITLAFEDTLERTVAAMEVPPALRGSGFGALAAVNGVGDLLSSAAVGVAWSALGASAGFTIAAALCATGTASLVLHSSRARGRADA
jgi:hypothetical protein